MSLERIDIQLPGIQIPLEDLEKIRILDCHLKKLKTYSPLRKDVTRRVINPDICSSGVMGYSIHDWFGSGSDSLFRGTKYFTIEELNEMQD